MNNRKDSRSNTDATKDRIAFGKIGRPQGVRGDLRFFPHNDQSPALKKLTHGILILGDRQLRVNIEKVQRKGAHFALRVREINDRDVAATWTHAQLWIDTDIFPEIRADDTFYHWQLTGLKALDADGDTVGVVHVVENYGAGDMLIVRTRRGYVEVPFMDPWVGAVDLEDGTVIVDIHWLDP